MAKKFLPFLIALLLIGLPNPSFVLANCSNDQIKTVFGCVDKNKPLETLTKNLIDIANIAIPVIALTMLIVAGFIWAGSSGNPDRIKLAKDIIFTTILSVVAYLLLRSILFYFLYGKSYI